MICYKYGFDTQVLKVGKVDMTDQCQWWWGIGHQFRGFYRSLCTLISRCDDFEVCANTSLVILDLCTLTCFVRNIFTFYCNFFKTLIVAVKVWWCLAHVMSQMTTQNTTSYCATLAWNSPQLCEFRNSWVVAYPAVFFPTQRVRVHTCTRGSTNGGTPSASFTLFWA